MIGPTLDDLIGRTRAELSEGDPDFFTEDVVTRVLNAGQDQIASDCPWAVIDTFTTTTVPGSPSYRLPTAVVHPKGTWLYLASGQRYRMRYTEPDRMESPKAFVSVTSGLPREVTYRRTRTGVEVELWPGPNQAFVMEVEAQMRPTPLVNGTDRTDLDPLVCPVLVTYALWKLKGKDEEQGQNDRYQAAYEAGLSDLRARRTKSQMDMANVNRSRRSIFNWRIGVRW